MIEFYDYKNNCWWCGSLADSAEHQHKRSDLTREFGDGPYKGHNELLRFVSGQQRKVQGPNSKETKFKQNLCQECNNSRSQPFDLEYDKFTAYIKSHEDKIINTKQFRFSEIYGASWATCRANLLRYYVKHICCRLASSNILIRKDIIDFLNGKSELAFFVFYIEIREDIVAMVKKLRAEGLDDGCLWIGPLIYDKSQSTGTMSRARGFHGYRWLRMNYLYDDGILKSENNVDENIVNLPSSYNLEPNKIWDIDS